MTPLLLALTLAAFGEPNADPSNLTIHTLVHPVADAGKTSGCAADFKVIHGNRAHDGGVTMGVTGSLRVEAAEGTEPVLVLELGAVGLDGKPAAPTAAGLMVGGASNSADLVSAGESSPGYLRSVFRLRGATMNALTSFTTTDSIQVYYHLGDDHDSGDFTADFRVADFDLTQGDGRVTSRSGAGAAFNACLAEALWRAEGGEGR